MQLLWMAIVLPAVVVGFCALLFGLWVVSLKWIREARRGLRTWKFKLWHIMAAVVVAALLFHVLEGPPGGGRVYSLVLLCLLVLAWFVRAWCNEFVTLMNLRDDDFPGRNDKLIWAAVLLAFAPISVWFFRSYRLSHWPVQAPVPEPLAFSQVETPPRAATQPA
jgi:hypothetical protein